jgi:oxygen-independent coproporphyrinogen-3 oxidase
MTASPPPPEEISVYLHWPYCAAICPYCDFNVYKNRDIDIDDWRRAFMREIDWWAERAEGRKLASIYFGGGTPSLAPPALIRSVINYCTETWRPAGEIEITLEANPTDAETGRFAAFHDAGVNRLSLGVQSFNDASLKFLGRNHDGASAMCALETAQKEFARVTFDLIYALPGQTPAAWRAELERALAMGAGHLSLYQLTIEPGTAFDRAVTKRRWAPADEDLSADLFDLTQELTASAGMPAYEVSNHARGQEQSRHNLVYWRGGDYAGIGPGAHGRLTEMSAQSVHGLHTAPDDGAQVRRATATQLNPARYLDQALNADTSFIVDELLTENDWRAERFSMGLRTTEGVIATPEDLTALAAPLQELRAEGLIEPYRQSAAGRIVATKDGRRLLNHVLKTLFV